MGIKAASVENVLIVTLGLLSVSLFFSQTGISTFGPLSLVVLLFWKYAVGYEPSRRIPKYLFITTILFIIVLLAGALTSDDRARGFEELKKYYHVLLAGFLYGCPLGDGKRRYLIGVFLAAASVAGLIGMFQYYGIGFEGYERARGFAHPIHYATVLSFACVSALAMAFIPNDIVPGKGRGFFLVLIASLLTFAGIFLSKTRGVWVAFASAGLVTMSLHSARKAAVFAVALISIVAVSLAASGSLRERAVSMVTSFYTEDETGSTGSRLELWKGTLMIAREHPVLGTGTGDFEHDIDRLLAQGKLKKMLAKMHAHNIYLQWLSTQGAAGLVALLALLSALVYWGYREARGGRFGGYVIVASTLVIAVGGLSENSLGISKIFASYCFTIGLFGGYGEG